VPPSLEENRLEGQQVTNSHKARELAHLSDQQHELDGLQQQVKTLKWNRMHTKPVTDSDVNKEIAEAHQLEETMHLHMDEEAQQKHRQTLQRQAARKAKIQQMNTRKSMSKIVPAVEPLAEQPFKSRIAPSDELKLSFHLPKHKPKQQEDGSPPRKHLPKLLHKHEHEIHEENEHEENNSSKRKHKRPMHLKEHGENELENEAHTHAHVVLKTHALHATDDGAYIEPPGEGEEDKVAGPI